MHTRNPSLRWRWELLLAALACATSVAIVAFHLAGPTRYRDLLAGQITYLDLTARPSYWIGSAFLLGFAAALSGLVLLTRWIGGRLGQASSEGFLRLLTYASLPMVVWLGSLILDADPRVEGAFLATAFIVALGAFYALASAVGPTMHRGELTNFVGVSVLVPFMAGIGGVALCVAYTRLAAHRHVPGHAAIRTLASGLALAAIAWIVASWIRQPRTTTALSRRLRGALIAVQALFPVAFLVLVPTQWQFDGVVRQVFRIQPALFALIGLLAIVAWLDLARRGIRGDTSDPLSALSPFCLAAILLLMRLPMVTIPAPLGLDDYHLGEKILPWWQWKDFGLVPFVDFSPVHGFIDVLYGFVADLFFSNTAGGFAPAANVVSAGCFVLLLLGLTSVFGPLTGFFFALLAPAKGNVYFVVIFALCLLLRPNLLERPRAWLVTWISAGTLLVLFAPGQSAAFVMACLPFAVWMAYRALREDRAGLLKLIVKVSVVAAALAFATPLGRIVLGTMRFGIESAAVNSVAFAKGWALTHSMSIPAAAGIWELARVAWIPVAALAMLAIPSALADPSRERGRRRLFLASTVLLFLVLMVPYSMGRNPPAKMARAGLLSGISLSIFLPLLVCSFPKARAHSRTLVLLALAAALLVPEQSRAVLRPLKLLRLPTKLFTPSPAVKDGASVGLPRVGLALLPGSDIERLNTLAESLDNWLRPGETYLDLTNRNAHHFYLGYPAPMESAAYFNLVHPDQQRRSIARMELEPPPVVLLRAGENPMKQALPLRAHLLYRWVLGLDYSPVVRKDLVFLVRPDRLRPGEHMLPHTFRSTQRVERGFRNGIALGETAGIMASHPRDVIAVVPGDTMIFAHSGKRIVERTRKSEVWLDGPPLDPELDGQPAPVRIVRSATSANRRLSILEFTLQKNNLGWLPIAWGRSNRELERRIEPGLTLGDPDTVRLLLGAEATEDGGFRLPTRLAAVRFVLAKDQPKGETLGLLRFEIACGTLLEPIPKSRDEWIETQFLVTWRSENKEPRGTTGLSFQGRPGEVIVPLDTTPRWLVAEGIYWLQIELSVPGACTEPVLHRVRLDGRRL